MSSLKVSSLVNHFLMAMPSMADPNFDGSVVLLAEHSDKGAMGLVVNRAMSLDLADLFERIDLDLGVSPIGSQPVLFGGPVQTDRGFVLHQPLGAWSSSIGIGDDLALTSSRDILEAVAVGQGPDRFLVTLGYSGWGPGQLEDELSRNAWLTVPADAGIIFDTALEQRFQRAYGLLGVDPVLLSGHAGHA
ncbi:MAG: YqgE/AlgH family protein [Burkholderiaceae bacterium]